MGDVQCGTLPLLNNSVFETSPKYAGSVRFGASDQRVNASGYTDLYIIDDDGESISSQVVATAGIHIVMIIYISAIMKKILILHTDPVVALVQSSYMLNEGQAEETVLICVALKGPSGGLATGESFNMTFCVLPGTASNAFSIIIFA